MSFHVHFAFSIGLSKPIPCPKRMLGEIMAHVARVESVLKLKTEQYEKHPRHWTSQSKRFEEIDDKVLCREVEEHNRWVRWLYDRFGDKWKNIDETPDKITPEDAKKFWHALEELTVPSERWTADYYRARIECAYEVMRGRETDGITFDSKPLSIEQADEVINLFAQFLDTYDIRLAVPLGYDHLLSSSEDGYAWCEVCGGAIHPDEIDHKVTHCRKRSEKCGGCPVRNDYGE